MRFRILVFFLVWAKVIVAQNELFDVNPFGFRFNYASPDKFVIANIEVSGLQFLDSRSLVALSGLKIGDEIKIPGDDISNAIRKLWDQGILGDVQVLITNIEGNRVSLEFVLKERPRLSRFEFVGVKKGDQDDLKDKIKLIKGKIVTDAVLKNTQNTIKKYYQEKGFYNASVKTIQKKDSTVNNSVVVTIAVTKNRKVKVKEVNFENNEFFEDKILARKLKKTKGRAPGKFWVSHKFNKTSYEEDKKKLTDFYLSKGYRDFRIDSDSIYFLPAKKAKNQKRFLGVKLDLNEGKKYYFRNIYWTGNYIHPTSELASILNVKKGDVYDKDLLDKKLNYNPNGLDISSLYMDNGYLFFQIEPIEVLVENDSIDLEMRIFEGEQATIDKVSISGNTKTNDHVILREIRTIPGRKFSRSDLIRSQREIATLGYFDPEKIDIQPVPNPQKGTVDINYDVTEKPSDQIQLSGGWGGFFGFVGTLGVVFNNFSARSISDFRKWDPLPAGDGQRLSLSFQANGPSFQSYAFSFTEPWLGGKKPHSFTVSLNRSVQNFGAFNNFFRSANQGSLKLNNIAVTIGKRLRWPDDYFTMSHTFSYLLYELKDYRFGVSRSNGVSQVVSDGFFNNFSITNTIARNNIDNPTYPRRGSSIAVSASLTPPYSLFQGNRNVDAETPAQRYKFVEYHKWMIDYSFFTKLVGNLVLNTRMHYGFLGAYNKQLGQGPFERFVLGGSGLTGFNFLLGYDLIGLRGYQDRFLQDASPNGAAGVAFNKYVAEIRYPISLNPMATLYVLGFAEAGNATESYASYDPFKLYRSAGVGARIFMPAFGMIGVDYGLAFDEVPGNLNARNPFTFTIGQQIR